MKIIIEVYLMKVIVSVVHDPRINSRMHYCNPYDWLNIANGDLEKKNETQRREKEKKK